MNANFFRTLLTWAAILVTVGSSVLGCTATGDCSASWLPPQWAGFAATGLLVLNQVLKAFQGGPVGTGLVAPTVVMNSSGAPGTVTATQVATGPKK